MERLRVWLRLASTPAVVRRSAGTCLVVGTILVAINHGGQIVGGAITPVLVVQAALTYLVPFVVSTAASVATMKSHQPGKEADPAATDLGNTAEQRPRL